ncbi:MAG: hypothetical protein RM338_03610 [Nostoc sp. DedQUE12a]|nr:hypothetical protein [Nostoc sp. DedQUE12a]
MKKQKFIYTSNKVDCPNCGGVHGCQIFESGWINCLRGFSQNDAGPGYKFVKVLKNGMGGLFAPTNQQQQRPEKYNREAKGKRINQKLALLSIEERDRQYRLVNENLRFVQRHREELQRRGLTEGEINFVVESGWLKTWNSGQLIRDLSPNLAGVDPTKSMPELKNHSGFAVWALDVEGRITGAQIVNDDRNYGKYLWLSSAKQGGVGQHLPNGESPLFVWQHPSAKEINYLLLVDGALASLITAMLMWRLGRIDTIVIGSAGMGFCSSRQTFQEYVGQLSPKQIIVCPDAGDIVNKQALQRVKETITLCQRLKYNTAVGWWGQITKEECDIDELLAEGEIEKIQIITASKFEAIAGDCNENLILKKLEKFVDKTKRGFQKSKKTKTEKVRIKERRDVQPQVVRYIPGELPRPEEWREMGCPKIRFEKGQQKLIWQEATVVKGWKDVLDKSHPGAGKSHNVGELQPEQFFLQAEEGQQENQDKLVYFCESSRNITTATIEKNFTELPVRFATGEIRSDQYRRTPLGNPFRIWNQEKQQDGLNGNCNFAKEHRILAEKNLGLAASASDGESDDNPICYGCPFRAKKKKEDGCQNSVGQGFGFKALRKNALAESKIRSTIIAFPENLGTRYGAFIDEAGAIIKGVSTISVNVEEFIYFFSVVRLNNLELYEKLRFLREEIEHRIQGITKAPDFGWDLAKIRQFLGEAPSNIFEIIEEVKLLTQEERNHAVSAISKGIVAVKDIEELISKNWLLQFLEIWTGVVPGSIRIVKGKITLTVRNQREQEILQNAEFRIYLDATLTRQRLATIRNIDVTQILEIEEEPPSYNNLIVTHVMGLGLGNKSRSPFCDRRIEALEQYFTEKHNGSYDSIDWKVKSQEKNKPGKIFHFSGDRGSNEYSQLEAVASFGTPYISLSAIQDIYQCLTGKVVEIDPKSKKSTEQNFQDWIDEEVEANIIQKIGRLRANRRPNEKLYYYHCSSYPLDLIKEAFPGASFEKVDAFELTPDAGDETQQSRWQVFEAVKSLAQSKSVADVLKLTQNEIAKVTGRHQSRISQIAGQFGGGKQFLRILAYLINIYIRGTNNFELSEEEKFLAQSYLPEIIKLPSKEALAEIGSIVRLVSKGTERFIALLNEASAEVKAKVLSLIMTQLPEGIQQRFLEMCNLIT